MGFLHVFPDRIPVDLLHRLQTEQTQSIRMVDVMSIKALIKQGQGVVRKNSPAILAGLGVSGVVVTAYLAHEAGRRTELRLMGFDRDDKKECFKIVWRHYIPPVIVGTAAITCIIGATRIGNRRTAAFTAAYSISERAFSEYKEQVAEKLGERKEQTIRDGAAQKKVSDLASSPDLVIVGQGPVPICELHTGRFFFADMETLKRAQNEINDRILKCDYANLSEFYTQVGQPPTESSSDFGWTRDRGLLNLEITTTLMNESRPCLAFSYNYLEAL